MSAKPVLYYSPRSPPSRAVLLTAAAVGVELDLRPMNLKEGDHLTPEFLKLNPQHTIPVLDDNGTIVSDSHVINAYLADKYSSDDTLYPKDQAKRREVDTRLYFDAGHLFPRVRLMVEPVIYFGADEIEQQKIVYMQLAYDGLEKCLSQAPYLCGEHLTIADLCAVASVSSAVIFAPIVEEKFPKLSAWLKRLSLLPYYQKNNQDGADLLGSFVKERIEANKKAKEAKK
ncbi:PREDICTED: glutathione S-transferase 1 [Rhagoletis zephyria]|uniref:glutathione S-transferase 1 n=1 Tax=Rhagoletis zephyria TaxID=28612 RepID=UPI00081159C9|nr:PREDICTED: glutathione S-transferase 1 [Rhagoletis zephyria]XP_017491278.1 PREDICTED: glutathione S-transferase 1 [Rhagoletis zephyria]XP_017491279.1 PREDICTED: glutathione S-transferase 1 [Rhagoletis zephyria]XP_017491280.1 PREDICTED: glutathione S-transferase 1 [Rhagoletis zephyria]XP_017491281.1 PREDICTED: glutathione S-transferase 1 [Rhagoletis zephyria]